MDVVCGVDLVDASPSEVAAAIASATGGSLHLVHAWQPVQPVALAGAGLPEAGIPSSMAAESSRETEIAVRERLSSRAALLAHGGLRVTWDVPMAPTASAILEATDSRRADLAVVGAPATGAMRWILGSAVEPLVRRSRVPVLVVREPVEPLLAWIGGERVLRVVAGIGVEDFETIVSSVEALRAIGPVEVDLVHAFEPRSLESFDRVWNADDAVEDAESRVRASLVSRVASRFPARLRISRERADRAISGLAARAGSDLVLVGTHGRRGIERAFERSVSTAVLRSAPCSVLVAPLAGAPLQPEATHP